MKKYLMYNTQDYDNPIPAENIFGKETQRLYKACRLIMDYDLHPYRGCKSPDYAEIRVIKAELEAAGAADSTLRAARDLWLERNPTKAAEIAESHRQWEAERDRLFRVVYGIAKRHGVFLDWHGKGKTCCCPDQWEVYKSRKHYERRDSFARIQMF